MPILLTVTTVLLLTLCALFVEPCVAKALAKRLEEDVSIHRNCRHIYSLLAGAAAVAAFITSQYNCTQTFRTFPGEVHTAIPHKVTHDQVDIPRCACTVLYLISAVTWSLFRKCGAREPEHAILANLLSLHKWCLEMWSLGNNQGNVRS